MMLIVLFNVAEKDSEWGLRSVRAASPAPSRSWMMTAAAGAAAARASVSEESSIGD